MCGEDIFDVKKAVSMMVAAKAGKEDGDQGEAMQHLVSMVSEELDRGGNFEEVEKNIGGEL